MTFEDADISGVGKCGVVAGYLGTEVNGSYVVANLKSVTVTASKVAGESYAGGIAGQANTKKFDNCQNYGNVTSVMSHANASTGGLAGFTTSNTVLNACSSQSDVTSSGTLGAASLFVGGQGNTKQTWDNSTLGGNLVVSGDIIGAYIQGWFVNPDAAKAAVTVGSVAPLKIKAGSTFNGVAVSAADLVLDRLFGAPGVAVVTCPEGAVVIE